MKSVIETQNLTKFYGTTLAVDNLNITVGKGQIFGSLGPNGSGKTTTIGMLLGILSPTSGSFSIFGNSNKNKLVAARRRIGAILEQPNFYPYLSGRQNLKLVARVKGVASEAVGRSLERVSLTDRADDWYKNYSLGMKQRLAIGATLLGNPDLLVLDEPTNGLDPEGMREMRRLIRKLGEAGTTIFLSSHLLWEVERVCSHVAILRHGRVVRQAPVVELTTGTSHIGITSTDLELLEKGIKTYNGAQITGRDGRLLLIELEDEDPGKLNMHLTGQGIEISHLEPRRKSLEEAFHETTDAATENDSKKIT